MTFRSPVQSPVVGPEAGWAPLPSAGDLRSVYLHSGHVLVFQEPCRVTTVLGSCVSVGIWDAATGIGGINHFLLPQLGASATPSSRFGNIAMRVLIDEVVKAGGRRRNLQAKLFGGACVLPSFQKSGWHLGKQNVQAARLVIEAEGIPLLAEDVEGERGRKLVFQTHDGTAWVRAL